MEIEDRDWRIVAEQFQLYQQQMKILQQTSKNYPDEQKVFHTIPLPLNIDEKVEYVHVYLEHQQYVSYREFLQEWMRNHKAEVEKILHLSKHANQAETWASRWVATPVAYLFPKERREEWLGDLYEINQEMLQKKYPRWLVNMLAVGRTVLLVGSGLHIKLSDLLSLGLGRIR